MKKKTWARSRRCCKRHGRADRVLKDVRRTGVSDSFLSLPDGRGQEFAQLVAQPHGKAPAFIRLPHFQFTFTNNFSRQQRFQWAHSPRTLEGNVTGCISMLPRIAQNRNIAIKSSNRKAFGRSSLVWLKAFSVHARWFSKVRVDVM